MRDTGAHLRKTVTLFEHDGIDGNGFAGELTGQYRHQAAIGYEWACGSIQQARDAHTLQHQAQKYRSLIDPCGALCQQWWLAITVRPEIHVRRMRQGDQMMSGQVCRMLRVAVLCQIGWGCIERSAGHAYLPCHKVFAMDISRAQRSHSVVDYG